MGMSSKYEYLQKLEKKKLLKQGVKLGVISTTVIADKRIYETFKQKETECQKICNDSSKAKMFTYSVTAQESKVSQVKVRKVVKQMES